MNEIFRPLPVVTEQVLETTRAQLDRDLRIGTQIDALNRRLDEIAKENPAIVDWLINSADHLHNVKALKADPDSLAQVHLYVLTLGIQFYLAMRAQIEVDHLERDV